LLTTLSRAFPARQTTVIEEISCGHRARCRSATSLSSIETFEPLLVTSPAFPSAALPQLNVSHVLELQPLVLAHLRFDVLPDPLIQLEKALRPPGEATVIHQSACE
jgi:hypothetical protein